MAISVTPKAVSTILSNPSPESSSDVPDLVVQVVDLKATGTSGNRFMFSASDGERKLRAILPSNMSTEVMSGNIQNLGLIRILDYTLNDIPNKPDKYLIVTKCEVVSPSLEMEIKTEVKLETEIKPECRSEGTGILLKPKQENEIKTEIKSEGPGILLKTKQEIVAKSAAQIVHEQRENMAPAARMSMTRRVFPLVSLNPYQGSWTIKVRVTSKGNMRTYKNARGEGCVFNVELTDEEGTQIQATMFNEAAKKFYDRFQLGKVYYISKGTLKLANKQFKTVKNDYEMTLNENSEVEEAGNEEAFVPETKFNFVQIDQLGPYVNANELVDIIGVVQNVSPTMSIRRKSNNETIPKRDITVADETKKTVVVSLWNEHATNLGQELLDIAEKSPIVAIKSLKVGDFQGVSLSASYEEYRSVLAKEDPEYVPYDVNGQYGKLFHIIERRESTVARSLALQKQLRRYAPVSLDAELTGLTDADREALVLLVNAAKVMDTIFYLQVWYSNPALRDWLKEHADASELDKLKWMYYVINKSPWSCLDENEAFLTTADSAIKLLPEATRRVSHWKGLEYRAAFPMLKPPGANFYPPDMDKREFELWKSSLTADQQQDATGFFNIIKRHSEFGLESSLSHDTANITQHLVGSTHDLYIVPFPQEYKPYLKKASELLQKAGDITSSSSLKRLLHSKANALCSNDYYESDIAWMELDSKLDVTIGPYETYEDTLFGYKATFEAFIGVRDDKATAQLKLFGDNLKILEQNLPMESVYKSEDVTAAPIRVIHLLYNAGDVKGPQTVAFNLPNDERIVKDRGTSMVMLKNVSEAKFKHILQPIADVCITKEQQGLVDFESFFTHTICHECCHGIGPHSITLPNGEKSTVRLELQELHSALEEAKADIVGLWALRFLIHQDWLPKSLLESMYVSFLAGCFRSVRFGLQEAHGKGQALQFNWLYDKGAFILHPNETFSVDFSKVEDAVESLSREILTIQAKGDKEAADALLQKYGKMTQPLKIALQKLEDIQVPVDIAPIFPIANKILE